MRKGTHSCLECRQRKVRCVSEPHARKCNGCSARELPCTNQESYRSTSPISSERRSTRDRFQKIEGMLDQVLRNQSRFNEGLGHLEPESSERNDVEQIESPHLAEREVPAINIGANLSRKRRKVEVLVPRSHEPYVQKTREIGDEPFLKLFGDVDNRDIRDSNVHGSVHAGFPTTDESAHRIIREFRHHIPNSAELMSILQAGRSTMSLWSGAFPETLGAPESVSLERLRDHIYRCSYSSNIADVTKLMLCLALHIQQLPSELETVHMSLPAPLDHLQEYYMMSAESLLSSDERLGGTMSGLECMILQSEFYINVGHLRKVWLIIRRAVNIAQLLGLHRKILVDVDSRLALRRNAIWTELWQRERGFSLILGLPCSTLDSQIPPLAAKEDESDLERMKRFLQDLGIVMGHIVDRDQDSSGKTYSTTLKIEEQLEECQSIMPAQWWDFKPDSTTPTDAIRDMFVAKMRFYTVQRLLHLPFLLKAFGDRRFDSSRLTTLQSAREIIKVYHILRDEQKPVLKVCDMVDFQVFAAAMTLVIDLLAWSGTLDHNDLHREERDWELVLQTAEVLGHFSSSRKGCEVAVLGARVLEDFSQLRNGPAEGVSRVDIPYFGQVEIRRRDARQTENNLYPQSSTLADPQLQSQHDPVGTFEDPIESIISPDSYLFPHPAASQPWQSEDESWIHMLKSTMADDWSWFLSGDAN